MKTIAPGRYALIALTEDEDDGRTLWPLNLADETNRNAKPLSSHTPPAGAFLLTTSASYTGHSVDTPFGPLTASDLYGLMPVDSDETNFLPNIKEAYNWIVLDIPVSTAISASGTRITVGEVSFDVEDAESMDDCPGFRPTCPAHALSDVGFSIVDEDYVEIAAFTAADREYGNFTFLFKEPRLDYDLQHITIDDAQRTTLEAMDTPIARNLLTAWDARADLPHMCLMLRKDAPAVPLARAA